MNADVIKKVLSGGSCWFGEKRDRFKITGSDRVRFLNGQVTNDVARIEVGKSGYAATCTAKGKMVADLWISNEGEFLWVDTLLGQGTILKERLEKYLIADDVEITEAEEVFLRHEFGGKGGDLNRVAFQSERWGYLGMDYWSLQASVGSSDEMIDEESLKYLRILSRTPVWGKELSSDILPPEAGMDRRGIRYDKGCYVGQEVMARIKSIGHVNKVLVLLISEEDRVPEEGARLVLEGKEVGWITSSSRDPLNHRGVALGYVSWKLSQTQSKLMAMDLALTIQPENA
jgi:tRNA-modifying protein YgfZ